MVHFPQEPIYAEVLRLVRMEGDIGDLIIEGEVPPEFLQYTVPAMLVTIAVFVLTLWIAGLYHVVLRYVGIQVMGRLTAAVASALVVLGIADFMESADLGRRPSEDTALGGTALAGPATSPRQRPNTRGP